MSSTSLPIPPDWLHRAVRLCGHQGPGIRSRLRACASVDSLDGVILVRFRPAVVSANAKRF